MSGPNQYAKSAYKKRTDYRNGKRYAPIPQQTTQCAACKKQARKRKKHKSMIFIHFSGSKERREVRLLLILLSFAGSKPSFGGSKLSFGRAIPSFAPSKR